MQDDLLHNMVKCMLMSEPNQAYYFFNSQPYEEEKGEVFEISPCRIALRKLVLSKLR